MDETGSAGIDYVVPCLKAGLEVNSSYAFPFFVKNEARLTITYFRVKFTFNTVKKIYLQISQMYRSDL